MKYRIATRIGSYIAVFGLMVALLPISAQTRDLKLGVVSPGRVLEKIPHTQEARERIEREFSSRTRQIKGEQEELQKLEEKFERDGAIMGSSERDRLERDVVTLKRSLKRDIDELREDRSLRENQELGELQTKIVEVIQAIGKEGKFDLILVDGVIYADKRVDITDEVISRLDDEFKRSSKDRGSKR